jgi:hypothetical protein
VSAPSTAPTPYAVSALTPILAGGQDRYYGQQLSLISISISSLIALTPQAATAAPKTPIDGMVRLARDPWRPVAGQTTDQWVYYDAAGKVWRLQGTSPTNT